jgi:hypothetical protein
VVAIAPLPHSPSVLGVLNRLRKLPVGLSQTGATMHRYAAAAPSSSDRNPPPANVRCAAASPRQPVAGKEFAPTPRENAAPSTTGVNGEGAQPEPLNRRRLLSTDPSRRHRRQSVVTAALVLLLVGCSAAPQPGPRPPGKAGQAALGQLTPDEQKAVRLAQEFLENKKTDWGSPTQVEREQAEVLPGFKGEGVYRVSYATPPDELPLLGDRGVIVDVKTGRTAYVPRD